MENITTPQQVISELNRLIGESQKGIQALYEAEVKVAELDQVYERSLALGFLEADGTIPERTAKSKLAASDAKLAYEISKAEMNRVKAKLRSLESAQMAVSVIAKQVELQWRTA